MKKLMKKLIPVMIATIILSGCSIQDNGTVPEQEAEQEQPKAVVDKGPVKGGVLNLQANIPDNFNPLLSKNKNNLQVLNLIYEGLVKLDQNMKIIPGLAERWEVSADGTTWTFYLRKNAKWHDNSQFSSKDVDFTLKAISNSQIDSVYKRNTQHISYFSAVDPYTVKIVLDQPYGNFLSMMTFPIIPKHRYEKQIDKTDPYLKPIGTGPYKFEQYSVLKEVRLSANSDWWNGSPPYIDQISVQVVPDENTALYALEVREIDLVPTDNVEWGKYSGKSNIQIKEYATDQYDFIGINFSNPILSDAAVRQAIAYGMDRDKIINDGLLGHGKVANAPINPESWLYDHNIPEFNYDVQKAKDLLAQAGWTDNNNDGVLDKQFDKKVENLYFELLINDDNPIREKVSRIIQGQLKNIGVNVSIKKVAWDEYNKLVSGKKFDAVLGSVALSPEADMAFAFHSAAIAGGSNFIAYNNPQMDTLIQNIYTQTADEQKKQAYSELQNFIVQELPYISLYFKTSALLYNGRIRGNINPTTENIYNDIQSWYLIE